MPVNVKLLNLYGNPSVFADSAMPMFMIYHSFRVNRHFHLITYQFYQLCLMVHMYQPYLAAIYHSTTFGHAVAAELLCCIVYNSCAQWHAHT